MKKVVSFLSAAALALCFQCSGDKLIQVTTSSEDAKKLYDEAIIAYQDVYYTKYLDLMVKAVAEDPEFFMANYQMAMYSLYAGDAKTFRQYGIKADKCTAILSKGEIIMKDALSQLLKKTDSDVRDRGEKLVRLFPSDEEAYMQLYYYQDVIKDYQGEKTTLEKSLLVAQNKAYIYNRLGYVYMSLNKLDEASKALDKYIELEPNLPNPYDSKGDYFVFIKDYRNAYNMFMKANAIDSTFSLAKAMKAKQMADSLGI